MASIPGSSAPALWQGAQLFRDPIGFLRGAHREYGDVFRVKFPGEPPIAYVADPDLARKALATDGRGAVTGETRALLFEPLVGQHSLLTLEGEEWERERTLIGPAFHGRRIRSWEGRIGEIAAERIETWPLGEPIALRGRMSEITLEVILQLVFGVAEGPRHDRLRELLPALVERASWYAWVPGPVRSGLERLGSEGAAGRLNPAGGVLALREEVDRLLYEEIAERRAEAGRADREDVLSLMIDAGGDDEAPGLSDEDLRDELMALLAAGHETTSTGLSWAFERLMRTPEAMRSLLEELDGGGDGGNRTLLDATVKETLRARPVVIDVARMLTAPLELGGREVPAGWMLAPAIVVLHHREDVWGDPGSFRPGRFLENPPLRAWIPFGGGRRRCVGSQLAQLEMRVVIREVLSRLRLRTVDPAPERPRVRHVTLVPEHGARAIASTA
ncbi:MAG TPA: cytochrome P450 [Solirubrobacterales bacterium]|nr:cytochrome P450 [Solirubrobacterales bacterium]